MILSVLFPALALLAGGAQPATPAPAKPRLVAIVPLEARDVSRSDAASVSDAVGSRVQASGRFRVMERAQMDRILAEQSFQASGACESGSCAVEIGRVLATDAIVVGTLGHSGSSWTLSLRLVDVQSGEVLRSASGHAKGDLAAILESLVPKTSDQLAGVAPARTWPWIVAGGVALTAAGTAALLLSSGDDASPPAPPAPEPAHPETGEITGSWK